jgi:pimeloyl-ACP methyl ester carboxylesterase
MNAATRERTIETNGIRLHVTEAGAGPLVILCHGWPELGYSWRHQVPALAAAGYHAVAPDMRGYGGSEAPAGADSYTIMHLVGDVVGLVAALGETQATIVGHDWGAVVAWNAALLRPDLFTAVCGMSVPYAPRNRGPLTKLLRENGMGDYYLVYFQEPGRAERDLGQDIARNLRALYLGAGKGDVRRFNDRVPGEGQLITGTLDPELPDWLTQADLAEFAAAFTRTGFTPGLNWYRNLDRNWELLAPWHLVPIRQPSLFIAGTKDVVLRGPMASAVDRFPESLPGLRGKVLIEGARHWIQQERPAEVNAALIDFLKGLP